MPWRPKPNVIRLERKTHELTIQLFQAKQELQAAARRRAGLEALLNTRAARIDQLVVQNDQLRRENRKLDLEAEHLAALFRETEAAPVTKEDAN